MFSLFLLFIIVVLVALLFRQKDKEKAFKALKESNINQSLKSRYKHIGIESQDDIQKIHEEIKTRNLWHTLYNWLVSTKLDYREVSTVSPLRM